MGPGPWATMTHQLHVLVGVRNFPPVKVEDDVTVADEAVDREVEVVVVPEEERVVDPVDLDSNPCHPYFKD